MNAVEHGHRLVGLLRHITRTRLSWADPASGEFFPSPPLSALVANFPPQSLEWPPLRCAEARGKAAGLAADRIQGSTRCAVMGQ
jgi:hypothetical protein